MKKTILLSLAVLGAILLLFVNVNNGIISDKSLFIIFIVFTLAIYIYTHWAYSFDNMHNPFIIFMAYSFLLWFLPFILIKIYSTYVLANYIYVYTIISFTVLMLTYYLATDSKMTLEGKVYNLNIKDIQVMGIVSLIISFVFTTLFFIKAGQIPMFSSNPNLARVEAMRGAGYIHRVSYISLSIGALALIISDWNKKRKISMVSLLIITLLVAYNSLTGVRSQALKILLQCYMMYSVLCYGKVKFKKLIPVTIFLLISVGVMGALREGKENIVSGYLHLINRLFMNPINLQRIVNVFIDKPYMYGKSIITDFSVYLPGHQENTGTILKQLAGAKFEGGGITVTLLGEGFMNFGFIGIILNSILCALIFSYSYKYLINKESVDYLILMIILATSLMGFISMGIFPVLAADTVPTIVVFIGIKLITKIINKHKVENEAIIIP